MRQFTSWLNYFFSRLLLLISFLVAAAILGLGSGQKVVQKQPTQKETLSEILDQ